MRRVLAVVVGGVLAVFSLGLLVAGGVGLWAANHDHGYIDLGTKDYTYKTDGYALTTEGWNASDAVFGAVGKVRARVTPADGAAPMFVGLAPSDQINRYLADVQYTTVHDSSGPGPSYTAHAGSAPKTSPDRAGLWVAHASGSGPQTMVWKVQSGAFALVAMNADGSPAVSGRVDVAAKVPSLPWIAAGVLLCGALLAAGATTLIVKSRSPRA